MLREQGAMAGGGGGAIERGVDKIGPFIKGELSLQRSLSEMASRIVMDDTHQNSDFVKKTTEHRADFLRANELLTALKKQAAEIFPKAFKKSLEKSAKRGVVDLRKADINSGDFVEKAVSIFINYVDLLKIYKIVVDDKLDRSNDLAVVFPNFNELTTVRKQLAEEFVDCMVKALLIIYRKYKMSDRRGEIISALMIVVPSYLEALDRYDITKQSRQMSPFSIIINTIKAKLDEESGRRKERDALQVLESFDRLVADGLSEGEALGKLVVTKERITSARKFLAAKYQYPLDSNLNNTSTTFQHFLRGPSSETDPAEILMRRQESELAEKEIQKQIEGLLKEMREVVNIISEKNAGYLSDQELGQLRGGVNSGTKEEVVDSMINFFEKYEIAQGGKVYKSLYKVRANAIKIYYLINNVLLDNDESNKNISQKFNVSDTTVGNILRSIDN